MGINTYGIEAATVREIARTNSVVSVSHGGGGNGPPRRLCGDVRVHFVTLRRAAPTRRGGMRHDGARVAPLYKLT